MGDTLVFYNSFGTNPHSLFAQNEKYEQELEGRTLDPTDEVYPNHENETNKTESKSKTEEENSFEYWTPWLKPKKASNIPISYFNDILISGYCREIESYLTSLHIIPNDIRLLLLKFYAREYFETVHDQFIEYMDGTACQSIASDGERDVTSYGAMAIPTTANNKAVYQWTLKIEERKVSDSKYVRIAIGIDEYHKYQALRCFPFGIESRSNYGYCSNGYLYSNNGNVNDTGYYVEDSLKYGVGDVISMTLDLKKNTLSFAKNDSKLDLNFIEIERGKGIDYRLAVCLDGRVKITITDAKIAS